ncbi:MAG: Eco57I restriction-modification methylase domain-containing protein [Candidatus Thorarchaeota archaeon]|jgi:Alw26I/Eco31I/Esp3I family type II restriction m6 adenine DNA methyltransferase
MLSASSSSLAWEIIREQRQAAAPHVEGNKRLELVESELVRLTALNHAFKIWSSSNSKRIQSKGLVFATLSTGDQHDGFNHEVLDITAELTDIKRFSSIDENIAPLSVDQFLELVAHIHSIGLYHLPDGQMPNHPQRVLGAYYTPREVSDFIADITLSPLVKHNAESYGEHVLHMKLIDPACGPGAFLLSAIRTCDALFPELPLQEVAQTMRPHLYGVDLDEAALEIADVSISIMCQQENFNSRSPSIGKTLKPGNSLISLKGWDGSKNHDEYFEDPSSRRSFEWWTQFPEVLLGDKKGFDILLMNPPYERLKPNFAEFMRERLLSGSRKLHEDEFERCKARLQENLRYYRNSGEYSLANTHTLDTYRLFIERSLRLVRQGGAIGFIVPSTILGDLSAERLRRNLILENKVHAVYDFPEGNNLFSNVTQSVSIMVLDRGATTKKIKTSFGLKNIDEARKSRSHSIEISQIPVSMQKSMVIPRIEREEWSVLKILHSNPILSDINWLYNRRGEFDLTLHKEFVSPKGTRLLRGSNIGRYTVRDGRRSHDEFVDIDAFHARLGFSTRIEDSRKSRIACQQISNRNQRWRLKFALVEPNFVLANSCNYIALSNGSESDLLYYLLGVLNSELLNWRFDLSSTNNHVSNRELSGLPLPDLPANETHDMVERIGMIAKDCALTSINYHAELEALVFALYGVGKRSALRILSNRGASTEEIASVLEVLQGLMNP